MKETSKKTSASNKKALEAEVYSFADVYERVEPSIVSIVSSNSDNTREVLGINIPIEGSGSGIIFHSDETKYYIVTNYHVVQNATDVRVSVLDMGAFPAKLVGRNERNDVAVISINRDDVEKEGILEVDPAEFGDSDVLRVGDAVLAIGNALGEGNAATNGIISAKNRKINVDNITYSAIQTNAAINPGNSGGALINLQGEIIGMNSAKLSSASIMSLESSKIEGMGYAIPSNDLKGLIEELMGPKKPMLGVTGADMSEKMAAQYNLPQAGAVIIEVMEGSPGEAAGIMPFDVITAFNGQTIFVFQDLQDAVKECKLNDVVEIKYIRNGDEYISILVELNEMADVRF